MFREGVKDPTTGYLIGLLDASDAAGALDDLSLGPSGLCPGWRGFCPCTHPPKHLNFKA